MSDELEIYTATYVKMSEVPEEILGQKVRADIHSWWGGNVAMISAVYLEERYNVKGINATFLLVDSE